MTASELLRVVLARLEERDVAYAVMRNFEEYPRKLTGDVDVVCRPESIRAAADAIEVVGREYGWKTFLRFARPYVEYIGLCRPVCPYRSVLVVEIFRGGTWYGLDFLTAEDVLKRRQRVNGIWAAMPLHAAVLSVFHHLLWNGDVPRRYRLGASESVRRDPSGFETVLTSGFGRRGAGLARLLVEDEAWEELARMRFRFRAWLAVRRIVSSPTIPPRTLVGSWLCARRSDHGIRSRLLLNDLRDDVQEIAQELEALLDAWHVGRPGGRHVKTDSRRAIRSILGPLPSRGMGSVSISLGNTQGDQSGNVFRPRRLEIGVENAEGSQDRARYIAHMLLDHVLWNQACRRERGA